MAGVKAIITTEEDFCKEIRKLISLRRYSYVKVCLPSSKEHQKRALPSDRILLIAWKCKDVERKRKEGLKDDTRQKPS